MFCVEELWISSMLTHDALMPNIHVLCRGTMDFKQLPDANEAKATFSTEQTDGCHGYMNKL
jgi:hypothetical protein